MDIIDIKAALKLKNPEGVANKIIEFIKEQVKSFNREGIVLGISGGIDSALGAYLASKAVGSEHILSLFLPERDSSPQSRKDAELVAEELNLDLKTFDISPLLKSIGVYKLMPSPLFVPRKIQERYARKKYQELQTSQETTFLKNLKGGRESEKLKRGIAYHRIKHRLRMIIWYYYGELSNYLIIGNCNKTEKLTGYFVKYGDSGSDVDPITPLFKTQVRELAEFLGVPKQIINKAPSPDLVPGITDEYALQITYEKLDQILFGLIKNIGKKEIMEQARISKEEIEYVEKLMQLSKHMRNLPLSPDLNDFI